MAGFDLNRDPATVETDQHRSGSAKRATVGSRAGGHRRRDSTAAITATPKRTNALWFFVAFLGGGAGVWWTKSAFPDNAWIAAMVAAGVVLALIAYYMLNDEDAPEEEGDNVYYLGLLFTLVSLMFTLVELFGSDTDAVRNAEKVRVLLENFGIALTSTVVGIAGRVAVQNWQSAPPAEGSEFAEDTAVPTLPPGRATSRDLERFNRLLLERIARELIRGVSALARFHRIVRSHASDTENYLRNQSETLERESAAFKDTLQRNAETFARELKSEADNFLDAVGGSLGATARLAEALPERLRAAHDAYLAEVRETTRSFHDEIRSASGQSLDSLRRTFDAAAEQSISLAQNVSTAHGQIEEAFHSLGSGLERASDASTAFGDSVHQTAKSTTVLEAEIEKLRTAVAAAHDGVEAMKGVLDAMGQLDARIRAGRDTEQAAAAVQQMGESLQTITAQAAAATEQTAKAEEMFDALTRNARTTEDETRRAAQALRVLADEAEARAESLRRSEGSGWRFWNRSR